MRGNFGWDYPPGVTGLEPQIAGYPNCANCGHEADDHGYDRYDHSICYYSTNHGVSRCGCLGYNQYPLERDPDEQHERRFE